MNTKKEALLKEIEALLSYKPENKLEINPNYLEYLELEDLESIKQGLMDKIGKLTQEDIDWLEQFKNNLPNPNTQSLNLKPLEP